MMAHTKHCTMSQEAMLQCPECPEELPTLRALQLHRNKAHPESKAAKKKRPQVSCDMCGRTFAHPSGMLYHKRTEHFEEKPFACEECGANSSLKLVATTQIFFYIFLNLSSFSPSSFSLPPPCLQTSQSPMTVRNIPSLEYHWKHIQECHPKEFHQGPECNKMFTNPVLEKHIAVHAGGTPYSCKHFQKSYQLCLILTGCWWGIQTCHQVRAVMSFCYTPNIQFYLSVAVSALCSCVLSSSPLYPPRLVSGEVPVLPQPVPRKAVMQELTSTEHFSQEGAVLGPCQLQLQEHLLSCHIGVLEEQASTSQAVIETEDTVGGAEQVIFVDQSQQVFVALGDGEDGLSSTEVMAVNVEDLLNGTVTFICGGDL
uniref:C2H2-type domain-containing protein n=1 Tax=Hucho hucho TaxID=62062 RepID=A0A4W5MT55_9TELE